LAQGILGRYVTCDSLPPLQTAVKAAVVKVPDLI